MFKSIKPIAYPDYLDLVITLSSRGQTSGEQSPEHVQATFLNAYRMSRLDKQSVLDPDLVLTLQNIHEPQDWYLLAETWCGDGAQCIPLIAKMAAANPDLHLKILLRDQHPKIMDEFLTDGKRAIPKLICLRRRDQKFLGTWGPRPKAIQDLVSEYRRLNPDSSKEELHKQLHLWYAQDKGRALQSEFKNLIPKWNPVLSPSEIL